MSNNETPLNNKVIANLGGAFSLAIGMSIVKPEEARADTCRLLDQGVASWYGDPEKKLDQFHGRTAANGRTFNTFAMTAAHKTLPFGTEVTVETRNGNEVEVTITDRGPYIKGRVIDLSYAAAKELGIYNAGHAPVKVFANC